MIVNKLEKADAAAAAALDRLLFSAESWSEADFAASAEDESRFFVAAREGDRLLGVGGLQISFEQGDILTIGVDPARRGEGIGSAMLEALLGIFLREGGRQLFLEVRQSNGAARALYEKFGFRPIGIRKNYYQQPPEDGLVYCLEVKE